jgi:hypothetical protein
MGNQMGRETGSNRRDALSEHKEFPSVKMPHRLANLRDDIEAFLEDLIADEVDHNVAAMWAGEQFNGLVLSGADMSRLFDEDHVLVEMLALLTDLGPRFVPLEVKPGSFERMLKRLRDSTPQQSISGRG